MELRLLIFFEAIKNTYFLSAGNLNFISNVRELTYLFKGLGVNGH